MLGDMQAQWFKGQLKSQSLWVGAQALPLPSFVTLSKSSLPGDTVCRVMLMRTMVVSAWLRMLS